MCSNSCSSIKLQLGEELRRINKVPHTLQEMRTIMLNLFGRDNFLMSYQDNKNDSIPIATDEDLTAMYELSKGKISCKINLKEAPEEISVFDRIDSLRKSLIQSVAPSQASDIDFINEQISDIAVISESASDKNTLESESLVEESKELVIISQQFIPAEEVSDKEESKEQVPVEEFKSEDIPNEKKNSDEKRAKKSQKKVKKVKKTKKVKKIEKTQNKPEVKNEKLAKQEVPQSENLSIHERITCDGCEKHPIIGIRYKCLACYDYDLCDSCENSLNHPHPMIKIKTPMNISASSQNFNSFLTPESLTYIKSLISSHVKEALKKKFKGKVIQLLINNEESVLPGATIKIFWEIMNKGRKAWPEGSKFVMKKGNLIANEVRLPIVEPGKSVMIEVDVEVPEQEKECTGVWQIDAGRKIFGKFRVLFRTSLSPSVREMVDMGFDVNVAKNALAANHGDISLALSQLLKQ